MSIIGISPTDIVKLLKGCVWLQERFEKNNSADKRLKQFINDINLLEKRLRRLAPALEDALERYEHPEIDALELQCDLHSLVGDIEQTILEAKELAESQIKVQRNVAGFIHNVVWAAHAEPRVDVLRKAMQFHAQKIFLVIEPINLKLLTTIDGKMDEMLEKLDRLLDVPSFVLPELAGWLDVRFREALFINQPTPFEQISKTPLKEGFDALYLHYRESTYAFRDPETAEQTAEQFLNLLKCQWLLNILREGDEFHKTGCLYPRVLKQIEQRIIREHKRKDIVRFQESELRNVNPTAFLIWPVEQAIDAGNATDANINEHIILRLSLLTSAVGEQDNGIVFRTGPTTFRIAKRSTDRDGAPYYENEHFNVHQDVFTPIYAVADGVVSNRQSAATILRASPSMTIYRGNATGAVNYRLCSDKDAFSFQRVITGYQVVFDKNVNWAVKQSGFRGQLHRGQGRMQIWHWKPLEETKTSESDQIPLSPVTTHSPLSQGSTTSDAVVERLLQRRDTSRITVDERSTTGSVICTTTPPHPVIVIFGKRNEVYTYYHIELGFGVQIVSSACPCEAESKKDSKDWTCRRSVVEQRDKKGSRSPFTTRTLTAERKNLSKWNLAVFAQPRHPAFENRKTCPELSTEFLNVDFASVEDRVEFRRKFDKALQLRNAAEAEYRRIIKDIEYLGEKNGRPPPPPPPSSRGRPRADSRSSVAAISDRPPFLRPLSPFSMFGMSDNGLEDNEIAEEDETYDRNAPQSPVRSSDARSRKTRSFGRWSNWIDRDK